MVQTGGNVLRTHALQLPRKDVPHDICGIFIYDQVIFVRFIFQIAVYGKCADVLAALALDLKLGADFHGNIPAVGFIYEILERNDKLVRGVFPAKAVVVVIDGDEPHAQKGKYLLDVFAGVQIISAKAGKIFYDDAVGAPRLYILQHLFEARTLKIGACEAVVDPDGVFPKLRAGSEEIPQQFPLPGDAVGFLFIPVVPRQSEVKRGVPDFCFLAVLHIASPFPPKLYLQCG